MRRAILWGCVLAFSLIATLPANASGILLTFSGLKDTEPVENFYNGGTGGFGSTKGLNFGITFSSNTLAIKSFLLGGSGNFARTPSGTPAIFFASSNGVMNSSSGFTSGVQFYYVAGATATVTVLDGTGKILASVTLSSNAGGSCGATYCTWSSVSIPFVGTAKSVVFSGSPNKLGISDITVGSSLTALPEPSSLALFGTGIVGLFGGLRRQIRW